MPKIYCSSCGNPIQYADIKPNFCTKCGCNLASGKVVQNQVKVEPEIEIIQKPSISSLNWDIEVTKPKGEKLKNSIHTKVVDRNLLYHFGEFAIFFQ